LYLSLSASRRHPATSRKGPETDPEIAPILDRGLAYLHDFAGGGGE